MNNDLLMRLSNIHQNFDQAFLYWIAFSLFAGWLFFISQYLIKDQGLKDTGYAIGWVSIGLGFINFFLRLLGLDQNLSLGINGALVLIIVLRFALGYPLPFSKSRRGIEGKEKLV